MYLLTQKTQFYNHGNSPSSYLSRDTPIHQNNCKVNTDGAGSRTTATPTSVFSSLHTLRYPRRAVPSTRTAKEIELIV